MTNKFGNQKSRYGNSNPGDDSGRRRPRIRPKSQNRNQPEIESSGQNVGSTKSGRFRIPSADDSGPVDGIDPKKRSIALLFDIIVAFCIAMALVLVTSVINMILQSLIPGIKRLLSQEVFIVIYFLLRDSFYQGRGIGKNLMGLRVVDAITGAKPTIAQSIKRNLIFVIPFLVKFIWELAVPFIPVADVSTMISRVIQILCTCYVILLIPFECYQAYSSKGGRRIGDRVAGTKVVESELDFSSP